MSTISQRVVRPSLGRRRPMLSRNADAIYWMSRYVERAEQVARLLWVHAGLLIDVGELAAALELSTWQGVLSGMRVESLPPGEGPLAQRVMSYLTLDASSPVSLLHCLSRARENARGIREGISAEMWESLNKLYWFIQDEKTPKRFEEQPEEVWQEVMTGSMLFQGLTDQTIPHDQRWHFAQVGKYLERIDFTCRMLELGLQTLKPADAAIETPLRNLQWMAVLRTCCSIEAFRQKQASGLDPMEVMTFLVLEREFPRSVLYCLIAARDCVTAIRNEVGHDGANDALRVLGRLEATLQYAQPEEIESVGPATYLRNIQAQIAVVGADIHKAYFLA